MRHDRKFWLCMSALVLILTLTLLYIIARAEVLLPQGAEFPGPESGKAALAHVAGMVEAPWGVVRTANLPPG